MGITIHFDGALKPDKYSDLISTIREFAAREGWPTNEIPLATRTLLRVCDEQDWDYVGPTRGLTVLPHPDCEPVHFEMDENLYVQEFCKTQFAPIEIHIRVATLLKAVAPLFVHLIVVDEGEYYDSGDADALAKQITWCNDAIKKQLDESPGLRSAVKLPSGRIIDLMD